jgi:hypothetical protein
MECEKAGLTIRNQVKWQVSQLGEPDGVYDLVSEAAEASGSPRLSYTKAPIWSPANLRRMSEDLAADEPVSEQKDLIASSINWVSFPRPTPQTDIDKR